MLFRRAIDTSGNPMPRVMNVDKNPAYPAAAEALKAAGTLRPPRRLAPVQLCLGFPLRYRTKSTGRYSDYGSRCRFR
jgi:hypothetical protein